MSKLLAQLINHLALLCLVFITTTSHADTRPIFDFKLSNALLGESRTTSIDFISSSADPYHI